MAVGLAAMLLGGCEGVDTGVHWYFERMIVQPRYEAYEGTPLFADGRVMRTPPGGTVPRGADPELWVMRGTAAGTTGAPEGDLSRTAGFPVPLTMELLELGRERFDITCAACHGLAGDGASAVAMKMQLRRPPSLLQPDIMAASPLRLYRVVAEGYGLMPSYAELLDWEERWAVVAYVKALQLSQWAVVGELPEPVRGEVLELLGGGAR